MELIAREMRSNGKGAASIITGYSHQKAVGSGQCPLSFLLCFLVKHLQHHTNIRHEATLRSTYY